MSVSRSDPPPPPPPPPEIAYPSWRGYLSKQTLETSCPDDPVKTRTTRTYYVSLITRMTRLLGFPRATWATAILLCTRFYAAHPVLEHPPFLIAIASLFVAGKVEETYKRLKDVLSIARSLSPRPEDGPERDLSFEVSVSCFGKCYSHHPFSSPFSLPSPSFPCSPLSSYSALHSKGASPANTSERTPHLSIHSL